MSSSLAVSMHRHHSLVNISENRRLLFSSNLLLIVLVNDHYYLSFVAPAVPLFVKSGGSPKPGASACLINIMFVDILF